MSAGILHGLCVGSNFHFRQLERRLPERLKSCPLGKLARDGAARCGWAGYETARIHHAYRWRCRFLARWLGTRRLPNPYAGSAC